MFDIKVTTKEGNSIYYKIKQLKELRNILKEYEKEPFVGVEVKNLVRKKSDN